MTRTALLLTLLLLATAAYSQDKGEIRGRVLSPDGQAPAAGATVSVIRVHDSSRVVTTQTGRKGDYSLDNIPLRDSLVLQISFAGAETYRVRLLLEKTRLELDPVQLKPAVQSLEEAVVKANPPLMKVKNDTVEFKASSFKTPPNAMAADLVRRLPGLTVDNKGKLFFNGKPVTTIMVDGRPFFNEDGGVALSNIPADMIDKIAISDVRSREEKLTGRRASGDDKTLNIQLKEGNKYFGNAYAAAGTEGRYSVNGLGTASIGKDRWSARADVKNVNQFDGGGIYAPMSFAIGTIGGGVTRTISGGLDYSRQLPGPGDDLSASYNINQPTTYNESVKQSQLNILPNGVLNNNSSTNSIDRNTSHTLMFNYRKTSGLSFTTFITDQLSDNNTVSTQSTDNGNGRQLNASSSDYRSKGNTWDAKSSLGYAWKFHNNSTLELESQFGFRRKNNNDHNQATTDYFVNGVDSQSLLRQAISDIGTGKDLSISFNYTYPLWKSWRVRARSRFAGSWSESNKTTWKLDNDNKKIGVDSLYSNSFTSTMLGNTTSADIGFEQTKWSASAGATVFTQSQDQQDHTRGTRQKFTVSNLSPKVEAGYRNGKDNVQLALSAYTQNPMPEQITPVPDATNPLHLKVGNPGLKPSTTYSNMLQYMRIVPTPHALVMNVSATYAPTVNKIVNAVKYDSLGRQTEQYLNVGGTYNLALSAGRSISLKAGTNQFMLSANLSGTIQHDKLFVNGAVATVDTRGWNPFFTAMYTKGEAVSVSVNYRPAFNQVSYAQNKAMNQAFTSQDVSGTVDLLLFKLIKWNSSLMYQFNNSTPVDLHPSSVLWNMGMSFLCMKGKRGEIKLTAYDLLRQNRNIQRTVQENTITYSQANTLQRYFLLGFAYHFERVRKG